MNKRKLIACLALCLAAQLALGQSKRIAWVSYHPADDQPSTNAKNAGATEAPDAPYTRLLAQNGYEVTRFITTSTPDVDLLNTFDLVIISRSVSSGHYSGSSAPVWNGLRVPVLIVNGYVLRSSRLGFTAGTTMVDSTMPIRLRVLNPQHPIFMDVPLDELGVTLEPYAGIVTFNGIVQRGVSFNTDQIADHGLILAVSAEPSDPTYGAFAIAEWPAGAQMANDTQDILGGRRLVFLTGSREAQGLTSEIAGLYDLTPLGERLFLNAVQYMISPPAPALVSIDATPVAVTGIVDDYGKVTLNKATLKVEIDGQEVQVQISNPYPSWTQFRYVPPKDQMLTAGIHTITVSVQDAQGTVHTMNGQFTIREYVILPEEWALSSASDQGMNVNIYMTSVGRGGNSIALAEWQLARGMIDPLTGQPYPNRIGQDMFQIDYVNWVLMRGGQVQYPLDIDDTPADGPDHFNTLLPTSNPIPNDWIPGTETFAESEVINIVAEVTCFLYLEPGYYRMGVNSDDGFLVSVAPGQPDIGGLRLGWFDGGRSASDTLFDFGVTKAGYYPFRLLWWQGTGGASCEWFTVDLRTGEYLLINGPQAGAVKAYRSSAQNRVHVRKMLPPSNFPNVQPEQQLLWEIEDGATTVDPASIRVVLNSQQQCATTVTKAGPVTTVRCNLPADLVKPNQIETVLLELQFMESNGKERSYPAQFTIMGWVRPWLAEVTEEPEFAIGINFGADEPNGQNLGGLQDNDLAGIVPQRHWNNTTGNTGTLANLVASAKGTAVTTAASVEWNSNNTWSSTGRGEENNGFPQGPDRILMTGYLDTPTDGTTTVTIRGIPAELTSSGYDLYIYALGGVSGRGGAYRVEDLNGNILAPSTTVTDQAGNKVQAVPFVCSGGNFGYFLCPGLENFSVPGNYIVFRGLTASDIVVVATTQGEWPGTDRAPINAIQLVKATSITPPQPPVFSTIGLTEDGRVVLTWEGDATLEEAEDLNGPWTEVQGAKSPYTVTPTGQKKFFRLKR